MTSFGNDRGEYESDTLVPERISGGTVTYDGADWCGVVSILWGRRVE
jgi:hypothetical protein